MKELIPQLRQAAKAYYQESREIMSNFEYDKLYDELSALEAKQGSSCQEALPSRLVIRSLASFQKRLTKSQCCLLTRQKV